MIESHQIITKQKFAKPTQNIDLIAQLLVAFIVGTHLASLW